MQITCGDLATFLFYEGIKGQHNVFGHDLTRCAASGNSIRTGRVIVVNCVLTETEVCVTVWL
jgi:hypothetical protein